MSDDKDDLTETKRIMARMLAMPPKPHKSPSVGDKGGKPRGRPPKPKG